MLTAQKLKILFDQGENISAILRKEIGVDKNTREIIEIAYDLQSGSYVSAMNDPSMRAHKNEYTQEITKVIRAYCDPKSILEAGVGEATTFAGVIGALNSNVASYGFDLSWSRIAVARRYLKSQGIINATLCTGDLLNMPFFDDSIDVVYTSHSIEPNGGREDVILRELYRVAKKYLILLEPGYELASTEARHRMDSHGYCKDLSGHALRLGYEVLEHRLFSCCANPMNPTAVTIIKKKAGIHKETGVLACPRHKSILKKIEGSFFSPEALMVYPIVGGIPCLRIENGIFASQFGEDIGLDS